MGTYYDRQSKLWRVQVQKHGRRISTTARTREEAQQIEAKYRRDLFLARIGQAPDRSLEDAIGRWLDEEVPRLKSRKKTESHARALIGYVEGKRIEEIGEVWEAYKASNAALSHPTLNRRGSILRRVGNLAYRWGWVSAPIGSKIKLLTEQPRHLYLTRVQVVALVRATAHRQTKDAILIAAYAGLRLGEIMRLQPADVKRGMITLHTSKSGQPRLIPVHSAIRTALARLPIKIGWRWLLRHFERAREACGMPHIRFHDLRHHFASQLINSGVELYTVGKLLGHSSPMTTQRYAHLATKSLAKAVRRLK